MKRSGVFLILFMSYYFVFPQEQYPEMVFVKGGTFRMGSNRGGKNERPVHEVVLNDFYIGKYEVTQAQWYLILEKDNSKRYFTGCDSCPVERVTWHHVQEFLGKLNEQTGMNYRLPTEAEWEYAAREGGNPTFRYGYVGFRLCRTVEDF